MNDVCRNLAADVADGRISQEEMDDLLTQLEAAQAELPLDGGAMQRPRSVRRACRNSLHG